MKIDEALNKLWSPTEEMFEWAYNHKELLGKPYSLRTNCSFDGVPELTVQGNLYEMPLPNGAAWHQTSKSHDTNFYEALYRPTPDFVIRYVGVVIDDDDR